MKRNFCYYFSLVLNKLNTYDENCIHNKQSTHSKHKYYIKALIYIFIYISKQKRFKTTL